MLRRVITITICMCLVGVTAVPASLLPCCCTFKQITLTAGASCPACANGKAGKVTLPAPERSCCDSEVVAARPCCSVNKIGQNCGQCRCREQMQIIAVSEHSVYQPTFEQSLLDDAARASVASDGLAEIRIAPTKSASRNIVLIFQTCSLLI